MGRGFVVFRDKIYLSLLQFFGPIVCIRCPETLNETVDAQHDKSKEKSQIEWVLIQKDNIIMIVELQQENESLKAEKKELEAKEVELEGKLEKLKGKTWQLDAEEDNIKQRAEVEKVENLVSAKWLERQILELEEELECPVCLEVAIDPPIFQVSR